MPTTEVLWEGKYTRTVEAGSVLWYWEKRELGISTVGTGPEAEIARPTVTQSVTRGGKGGC